MIFYWLRTNDIARTCWDPHRTGDLEIFSLTLSQLSYRGNCMGHALSYSFVLIIELTWRNSLVMPRTLRDCKFARVVKKVILRFTAGKCTLARTLQLEKHHDMYCHVDINAKFCLTKIFNTRRTLPCQTHGYQLNGGTCLYVCVSIWPFP